ncbi:cytochrome b [Hoeflea poritis]|uniref:Cytochrome b n=1 Tax=Hoeflea poritis TaxID=2993659 RepID=A0ABT4VRD6_9HYPH|nr:cytochrome b [Hoeflea poritis]MDA4847266.1 cytochrome b [Hoeflea poritis]
MTYDLISRFNHWIIALAMIGMLAFGIYIEDFAPQGPEAGALLQTHKAIGVLVLVYGLWRVGWRLARGFLEPAAPVPVWQDRIAKLTHWVLIASVILMPLSGMTTSLFGGHDIQMFGLFIIPGFAENKAISEIAADAHGAIANVLIFFIVLHVAGALKHHFVDRDTTLVRMTSGRSTR